MVKEMVVNLVAGALALGLLYVGWLGVLAQAGHVAGAIRLH